MSPFQCRFTRVSRRFALMAGATAVVGYTGCTRFTPRGGGSSDRYTRPDLPTTPERLTGLVEAHNRAREKAGLPALAPDERLTEAAQRHADDMAAHRRMSHRGSNGSSPFRRIESAGYQYQRAGENVAYGQRSVSEVMASWMASPGHRRNILGKYSEIGTAYATDQNGSAYWCVTFGRPEST
jgi:uncharacterized protein YkwD